MKKITILAASVIIVFCIVPIATIQAMPQQIQGSENVVSGQFNELSNPVLEDNVPTFENQNFHETRLAQGNTNTPYVKRRGHGRSTMRAKIEAADNSSVKDDDDAESDENFGGNSAIKFNNDLRNSSGYNEDL